MIKKNIYDIFLERNKKLTHEREVSFEEIISVIENGCLLNIIEHFNSQKYTNQQIYLIEFNSYIYFIPFVTQNDSTIFLKTIIPSRKATQKYLKEAKDYEK